MKSRPQENNFLEVFYKNPYNFEKHTKLKEENYVR